MKLSRLRGRKICANLQRKGSVWKGSTMVIRWLPGTPRHPESQGRPGVYVGTLASARLDKSAVRRNRMRRRCREALRVALKEYEKFPTVQLLIAPKSVSLTVSYDAIRRDISVFLMFLHGQSEKVQ